MQELLRAQVNRYPALEVLDAVKLCYQSEFGGGHLVSSREESLERLREETKGLSPVPGKPLFESIGGGLCRLNLDAENAWNLRLETINGLFFTAAKDKRGNREGFEKKLQVLKHLCQAGEMPFSSSELEAYLISYRESGYPPVSHSDTYRELYQPHYRVVEERAAAYYALIKGIDEKLQTGHRLIMAIDGMSGAGKSTLAAWIQEVYEDCNLFHMDDFFLPPDRKTAQRLGTPGGNVDYERFQMEVMEPLKRGESFFYRPYNCKEGIIGGHITAPVCRLNVVEGVYSLHPALQDAYGLKVFLSLSPEEQSTRILKRNGVSMHRRFLTEWIPLENMYFDRLKIAQSCDFLYNSETPLP